MGRSIDLIDLAQEICRERKFQLISRRGEGSYKQTFEVCGESGTYALKVYRPDSMNQRSQREIEAMQRCDHQGIAKLYGIGNVTIGNTNTLYTLEEFLDGGTLDARVQQSGLLAFSETKRLGAYLIEAIGYLRSLQLVHRDIKPENILFRKKGDYPVITDFGIVRDLAKDSLTQSWVSQGPGTYLYAAPEQLNNNKNLIDWRTDQFALGVTLSICSFGIHPYDGSNLEGIVENVAARKRPTTEFVESVKTSGLTCLEKMVSPWPVHRYRTPEELSDAWNKQNGG